MNCSKWIRQLHRWLAIAFTLAVIANLVVVAQGQYSNFVGLLALIPLILLMISGLYLFFLPYLTRGRSGHSPG
jgi:archaellum biogenesis protein FlaJ (TadC family)